MTFAPSSARLMGSASLLSLIAPHPAFAQVALPTVEVEQAAAAPSPAQKLDAARREIFKPVGANAASLDSQAIERLPQGTNQPLDKLLLRLPGVTQDSAASGNLHIRNEHSNLQYRVNGILLPDGVLGFGQFLETSFVGRVSLLDGVLPAQYGLRTAGIIDIETRSGAETPGGEVSFYGGSRVTLTPVFTYGGTIGNTDYYVSGRFLTNRLGIENPTSSPDAIHDLTHQGRFFGYASTRIDDSTRAIVLSGFAINGYQIPNAPGRAPQFAAFGVDRFDSRRLDQNQVERNFYNVFALQRTIGNIDGQLALFSRYSTQHFVPDLLGDLIFNGVASNVSRRSLLNGLQGDMALHEGPHTMRFGFQVSAEKSNIVNSNTLLPLDAGGNAVDSPFNITSQSQKAGWIGSLYAQDEWKLTRELTLNAGLRFDQANQYTNSNQVSPRVAFVYAPFEGTQIHAGYARYFTPPQQTRTAPTDVTAYANTTLQSEVLQNDPARPERSHYVDIGVTQQFMPGLEAGIDVYYKRARNLLDEGQFGQALVLTSFNYARAYNTGVEFKLTYTSENVSAYGNVAWGKQRATGPSSNQYLFTADELAYAQTHYVYTDHAQVWSGSAGASYLFTDAALFPGASLLKETRISADLFFGSGLRSGFANTESLSPYAQVNLGLSRAFAQAGIGGTGPLTLRFDIVNLFDHSYVLRDGSGIGVFAAQYGPRRGFFAGISQKF